MGLITGKKAVTEVNTLYRLESNTLFLYKKLLLPIIPAFTRNVLKDIKTARVNDLIINLDYLEDIDSAGVTSLFYIKRKLSEVNREVYFEGGKEGILQKIELFRIEKFEQAPLPAEKGFFEKIGEGVHGFIYQTVHDFMMLAANVSFYAITDMFKRGARREGETINQAVLIGVNAVLIIAVMSFVIGLVLALQTAQQLRTFGANVYIVDLTVMAFMSQMGPLITAILVAGRSGSAIAAEIATMKVTSELDALQTMGLNPIRFVVIPKFYAALITLPFLVIISSLAGIIGGAVAGYVYLDITPEVFVNRMVNVMSNKYLITGFIKSQVYASLVVLTGSYFGFKVDRGAEGVGKATTAAVVVTISLVIIADSIMGLIFY
jgi:phospholipid/cholesterol/gamma-HCH transport system permease protein